MSLNKKIKNCRHFFEYLGVLICFKIVKYLPRPVMNMTAWISGNFMYCVTAFRKLSIANITIAFPEKDLKEIKKIARKSFIHLVRSLLDFFCFSQNQKRFAAGYAFPDHDREVCETPFKKGNGLIVVAPHHGSWEIAGLIMKHTGYPFAVVARTMRNPFLDKLINSGRMSEGSIVIPAKGAIKGMVKSLKSGSMVATLIDQNTKVKHGGIFVDFFGLPVPASRAPAMFGRKFNVPLVVGGSVFKDGKYEMYMEKISKSVENYESDTELIQDLLRVTETVIRKNPEQYLWFYKRFQHIPRDADQETINKFPYYAKKTNDRFYDDSNKKEAQGTGKLL